MTEHKQGTLLRVREWLTENPFREGTRQYRCFEEGRQQALKEFDELIASVPDEPVKKEKPDWEYVNSLHDYLCTMSEILSEAVREE